MNAKFAVVPTLVVGALVVPALAKDWVFVTTNWNENGNEKVLVIDPENGQTRTLWNTGTELDAVVSPDATRLYVTAHELAVIDTATGAVLNRTEVPQLIRWIFPSTPGMAISSEGGWLYLLKANYSVGSSEYSLLRFDTRENRFISEEQPISNCPRPFVLPIQGDGKVLVLCSGPVETHSPDSSFVLRHANCQNFAIGRGISAQSIYLAGLNGRIQAVDVGTHEVVQTSNDAPLRNKRFMPSSDTISPDGRIWYLPIKTQNVSEQGIDQILVFDTQSMRTAGVITPPGPFWGLALSSD